MTELPEHVRRNGYFWDGEAARYAGPGRRGRAAAELVFHELKVSLG